MRLKIIAIAAALLLGAGVFLMNDSSASAGTCAALPSDKGKATVTKSEDASLEDLASGTYNVWSRVKHADGKPSYIISIYGSNGTDLCSKTVSDSNANNAGQWEWIKLGDTLNWKGGEVKIEMAGSKAETGLDCVVLHPSSSFSPSSKEDCNPASTDKEKPSVVSDLKLATSGTSVTLTWSAPNDNLGVKSYEIYRQEAGGSWSSSPVATPTDTTYKDNSVTAGKTYNYKIVAVDFGGNKSPESSTKSVNVGSTSSGCLKEDVDKNGIVAITDASLVRKNLSQRNNNAVPATYNINGDSTVNTLDILLVIGKLGKTSNCS